MTRLCASAQKKRRLEKEERLGERRATSARLGANESLGKKLALRSLSLGPGRRTTKRNEDRAFRWGKKVVTSNFGWERDRLCTLGGKEKKEEILGSHVRRKGANTFIFGKGGGTSRLVAVGRRT